MFQRPIMEDPTPDPADSPHPLTPHSPLISEEPQNPAQQDRVGNALDDIACLKSKHNYSQSAQQ